MDGMARARIGVDVGGTFIDLAGRPDTLTLGMETVLGADAAPGRRPSAKKEPGCTEGAAAHPPGARLSLTIVDGRGG